MNPPFQATTPMGNETTSGNLRAQAALQILQERRTGIQPDIVLEHH
jgi:hypothetical protein